MNPISEQQKKSVQNVKLTAIERGAMRNTLIQEMTAHPLVNVAGVRSGEVNRHQWGRTQLVTVNTRKRMTIAILIAILMSGSVSYAAEGTVPGDILYPIKIHVNENVESAFAVSSEADARLRAEFAERRIMEAEALHEESRLDEKTKIKLSAQFNEHTSDMEEYLRELADDDSERAIEISSDFEATLSEHVDTLKIFGLIIGAKASSSTEVGGVRSIAPTANLQGEFRTGELLNAVFIHNDTIRIKSTESVKSETEFEDTDTQSPDNSDNANIDGALDVRLDTSTRMETGEEKSRIELDGIIKTESGLRVGL